MVPEGAGGAGSLCWCWEEVRVTGAPSGLLEEEEGQGSRKLWSLSSGSPGGDAARGVGSCPSHGLEKEVHFCFGTGITL